MGLFDQLTEMVSGQQAGGLGGALSDLLNQQGGVSGLVEKFQSGGLGEVVNSWVSSGENLPVSAEQVQQVLGNEQIAGLAEKLGIEPGQLAQNLSESLPQLVDKLTPGGQVPAAGDNLLSQGLEAIKGLFGH